MKSKKGLLLITFVIMFVIGVVNSICAQTITDTVKKTKELSLPTKEKTTAEKLMIDQVVAVVGTKMVKLSDIEKSVESMRMGGTIIDEAVRCKSLENMLISNLYALQADEDSITIGDAQVEQELEGRLAYFIEQIGSKEKLEEFYGKSMLQIKEEYREMVRTAIISNTMESKITEEIRVTPTEIKRFYNAIPRDSIPLISMRYELAVIVKKPKVSRIEKQEAKNKLEALRARIEKGESFASMAALYSEDPGSRKKGGELGFGGRGEWASEFESMAFSTEVGSISPIFETEFGFHILEVMEKKGDMVKIRHILIKPKPSSVDLLRANMELDSVAKLIRTELFTFEEAVKVFSDESGKQGDGIYLNPYTGKPNYSSEELDPMIFMSIDNLAEGEVSNALQYVDESGNEAYRLFYVKKKTPAHKANLDNDYDVIYDMALAKAKQEKMSQWMRDKISDTYVRIIGKYANCEFHFNWNM